MSWRSLYAYPEKSPFYPEIIPFQKYVGCVTANYSNVMSASQDLVVTQNIPALPANTSILYYQVLLYSEENYSPADLRVGGCRLVNGDTQYQYTIHTSANIVGTHRAYVNFVLFYENDDEI